MGDILEVRGRREEKKRGREKGKEGGKGRERGTKERGGKRRGRGEKRGERGRPCIRRATGPHVLQYTLLAMLYLLLIGEMFPT